MNRLNKSICIIGVVALIFGICFAGCIGEQQMSADQISQKMQEKYDSINDMSCNMVMTVDVNGKPEKIEYTYKYKKPNKSFIENDEFLMASDGKTFYMYDKNKNEYMTMDAPKQQNNNYGEMIKSILEMYNPEYVGEEKISNGDCYILKLTTKNKTGTIASSTGNMKIWVDKEYWQPIKIEFNGGTIEYQNVKYNTGLDDSIFTITPPKGAKLMNNNIPKKMTIEEAQKQVSFTILIPKYTGDYEFNNAMVAGNGNNQIISITYTKGINGFVIMEDNSKPIDLPNSEKVMIGDIEAQYIKNMGANMLTFNKDGVNIVISGTLDKEELIKIAKSMI
ncbi:conserved hypothetical protein [Methanococcus aeolicus Nankai-3]|uniref:Uncharacterized protein n=1 Tax=Methanococcus aeolicus (strain ATCC BAA-1280 / DSM 17508 / OCM 812 / Nankai-3) TaxID=419665 RepID=A6UT98_META3|nr:DUF4367 domain-containing protein [Methanococcus aeolicus]ABR55720.1 conserved hypothetical protein [Methanococcus aeolicus Nankai-3]